MMSDLYILLSWYHAAMSYRWMVNSSLFWFIWFSEVSSFGGETRGGRKSPEVFFDVEKRRCDSYIFFFVMIFHSGVFLVMIFHSGVSMIGLVLMVIIMSVFYLLSLV